MTIAGFRPRRNTKQHEERAATTTSPIERIHAVIRLIPCGRVATYGQVATLAGLKGRARQVGYALRACRPSDCLPWQRVVNSSGRVSPRSRREGGEELQRKMLEAEGVRFRPSGKVDFDRYLWDPGPGIMAATQRQIQRGGAETAEERREKRKR